ncbi:hypothetical protein BP5796_09842 [Coleophoma crateriformis]|uniref:Aromatic amino acid beta-eliminating lyase/threonine aldolase domain-containing protein n=1 Tax=Coleophoma crateriformis TaxID=565419 RepID=A0A3D8QU15_9HELO|nr:hypothetical protein BP5796_09842 [Coleophoma crateriformis]
MSLKRHFIDLYADTKSKPTDGMRQAIATAVVGDEQKDEDPTVLELCNRMAKLFGKEAAVLVPSGTMANQIALQVHCRPAEEVICDKTAHVVNFEGGGPASTAGVMTRLIEGKDGIFTADQLFEVLDRPESRYAPKPRLVWVEQTSNLGGGTVWPLETIQEVAAVARKHGLKLHMDGARLLNAVVASGVPAHEYAMPFDSVWVDFTKGLGCPMGAILAGSEEFVKEAWRVKQRMGGGMRQAGFIAAAALYALDHNVERLADDHANAKLLAIGLAKIPGVEVLWKDTATNIVLFDVAQTGFTAQEVVAAAKKEGVGLGAFGRTLMRAVTYINIPREDIISALEIVKVVLQQQPPRGLELGS